MSLNLWTEDFTLAVDWGQDLDLPNCPFDDLKVVSCKEDVGLQDNLKEVDLSTELSAQGTIQDNVLDVDWMESSDLSLFFEELGKGQLERNDFTDQSSILGQLHGEDLSFNQMSSDLTADNFSDVSISFTDRATNVTETLGSVTQDVVLTPPESPEQVTPEISLELSSNSNVVTTVLPELVVQDTYADIKEEIFDQGLGFDFHLEPTEDVPEIPSDVPVQDFLLSPVSLPSGPSSPESSASSSASASQLIQSSPELFKVIATPSNLSLRFSPYPTKKSKCSKGKPFNEPAIEEEIVIPNNVSKKDRKKLQNKNAAIRYRIKKREEAKELKSDEDVLEEKNLSLKSKVDDLQREIKYMKNLIEDVCKAKGLIPTIKTEDEMCVN